MSDNSGANLATHFGRQMRKERLARGWSLRELASRTGVHFAHLSRVENGSRAPTEAMADALDRVFPDRKGWFHEYWEDSKSAMPPGLRSWTEIEDKAARLAVWAPAIVHGLFQTADYARVFIEALPVPPAVVEARLAARLARQQRVLYREEPPVVMCVADHAALYRLVGSPAVMAAQMRHLLDLAARPNVTVHVMPAVAHPLVTSELIVADHTSAYAEHMAAGGVYEGETAARLDQLLATIMSEAYRASESAAVIGKAEELWKAQTRSGVRPASAAATGVA